MAGVDPLSLASLGVGFGVNLAKGIFGAVQASKGSKQLNSLLANRPQYNISKGYLSAYSTYKQMAASQLPGYQQQLEQIGQSGAKTMDYAREGAMSSNQYMSAALQSQDKETDAIRNLGIQSAQWRTQQQQQLAGAQNQMGQLQDTQFQQNVLDPYNMQLNMANEKKQAGMANIFGGVQEAASTLSNFAGTSAYMQTLQRMYPQQGMTAYKGQVNGQVFSSPLQQQYSPQQNLLNTLQNTKPTINFP